MRVVFIKNSLGKPPDYSPLREPTPERPRKWVKRGDVSLHFDEGWLAGYALRGFVIWEKELQPGQYKVSPPNYYEPHQAPGKLPRSRSDHTYAFLWNKADDPYFPHTAHELTGPLAETIIDEFKRQYEL